MAAVAHARSTYASSGSAGSDRRRASCGSDPMGARRPAIKLLQHKIASQPQKQQQQGKVDKFFEEVDSSVNETLRMIKYDIEGRPVTLKRSRSSPTTSSSSCHKSSDSDCASIRELISKMNSAPMIVHPTSFSRPLLGRRLRRPRKAVKPGEKTSSSSEENPSDTSSLSDD